MGVSALSILQQREMDRERGGEDIAINHVHTEMTSHKGPLNPEEGAASSVFAASLPPVTDSRGKYIWLDCSISVSGTRTWAIQYKECDNNVTRCDTIPITDVTVLYRLPMR